MNTAFLLMGQYDGKVCRDYFSHLTPTKFLDKVRKGKIRLPLVRLEKSQKSANGVHLQDLANYIDERREAAC